MAASSTYSTIATTTLSSATASVTFSSIAATYTDLVLVASILITPNDSNVILRFNNDSTSLYSQTNMAGTGSVVTTGRESNQGRFFTNTFVAYSDTNPATLIINIMNYANTSVNKSLLSRCGIATATSPGTNAGVGLYRSTSAINRIDLIAFSSNLAAGSTFTLYGISAA